MQGWRFVSTLPYQKTNPDGVIGGRNYAETIQIHAENLYAYTCYWSKAIINSNINAQNIPNKPLGLVFWQGRRWSEATTLPQSAQKVQPLRVGLSNRPLISL